MSERLNIQYVLWHIDDDYMASRVDVAITDSIDQSDLETIMQHHFDDTTLSVEKINVFEDGSVSMSVVFPKTETSVQVEGHSITVFTFKK